VGKRLEGEIVTDQGLVLAPHTVKVDFALEPLLNAIDTMLLLSNLDNLSGLSDWVYDARERLGDVERHRHDLLVRGLKILEYEPEWPDFPAYLAHMRALEPEALRDQAMKWMADAEHMATMGIELPDRQRLLEDLDYYLDTQRSVQQYFQDKYADKEPLEDNDAFFTEVHALLNDPPRLKALALDHLAYMWEVHVRPAWERTLPMLEESVAAHQQLEYSGYTPLEAVRAVTGRDVSGHWAKELEAVETLVFVPSAHLGPFVRLVLHDDRSLAHVMFGARLPQGSRLQSAALSRSELLVRVNALADDTRLQILKLLTQHEELCAQDIMNELQLSQSSASRHLRQLSATGYLVERRRDVAKCYSLNHDRVEDTLQALRRFLTTS
jgi:DNA-binding transcriptional ArsR family regulator